MSANHSCNGAAADAAGLPPLVSCIMPTADRRAFAPGAIGYFLRQGYKENPQ
jgi:hypothetical protein